MLPPSEEIPTPSFPDFPNVPKDGFPNLRDGTPKGGRPRLGVQVQNITDDLRRQYHIPGGEKGAVVMTVEPGSIASGLNLQPGDVIESIGAAKIGSADDLVQAMQPLKLGDKRAIAYARFVGENVTTRAQLDVVFR